MPTLRSGLVIAGAYADKIRRTLFAQLRDRVRSGEVTNNEIARAAGELNRILFEVLVNRVHVDKGDVVRVSVDYDIEDSTIKWDLSTLQVQVWRRVPEDQVAPVVAQVAEASEEILRREIEYAASKLGETDTGDYVFQVTLGGREVGALLVTPLNETQAVVRGAVTEPTPMVLRRETIDTPGGFDAYVVENIREILANAVNSEAREAQKIIREIKALLEVEEPQEELE